MRMPDNRQSGIAFAFGSAILFGLSTPAAKLMLGGTDPLVLAGLLYLGAGIGLGIWSIGHAATRPQKQAARLMRADMPWLAGIVIAGGVAGPALLMLGLERTDAASASLLLNLEGLATMAIAWIVFRENVDRRLLLGAAAIIAGAVVLTWTGENVSLNLGALLIAGACLAWGIDNNLTRQLSASDPVQLVTIKGLTAGSVNLALGLSQGADIPGVPLIAAALAVGLAGYGVSIVFFVLALRHLGTARTGAYFSTAPFIGAVAAIPLFADPVTASLLIAFALMALGVWLHITEHHAHEHEHEEMAHAHAHVHDAHHQHVHGPGDPPGEPHTHFHKHARMKHAHAHFPDIHHRHDH